MKAIWKGKVLAESDETIVIENNHYFPPHTVNFKWLKDSDTHTECAWKGTASYKTVLVDGEENKDAAWYYPETSEMAKGIEGYYAFWKGVKITD